MSKKQPVPFLMKFAIVLLVVGVLAIASIFVVRYQYHANLKPVSNSQKTVEVEVPLGATVKEISAQLEDSGLVREAWAFEWYVRNEGIREQLQAGTYALSPSQSVQEIAAILARGEIAADLVTILPGRRIDQVRADLINSGFSPASVDEALKPKHYARHPALVDKPKNASLEGYLYPESFQKTNNTTPQDIIEASLDEMHKRLNPTIRRGFARQHLSVYDGIVLASIIEKEVSDVNDKKIVAQVFLKRIKRGMRLESDPTAFYGAVLNGQQPSLAYDSAYNTYKRDGLPPTPISNVSEASLKAVVNPAATEYLFFVAGDDGNTYFSKTVQEHDENVRQHCKKLCSQ